MPDESQLTELLRKHSSLFYVFLFVLGVLIAGLATITFFNTQLWQGIFSNVVTSIAAALMVASLIFFLGNLFGIRGQDNYNSQSSLCQGRNLVSGSYECGLHSVYDRKGNFGTQRTWIELIDSSIKQVDIMGRSLYGWTQSAETIDVIVNKIISDDVKFRWLMMDDKNIFLPQIIEQDVNIGVHLKEKLTAVCKLIDLVRDRLPSGRKDNFQVRQFTNVPLYFSILRVDDNVIINQYLFSTTSENSPLMHLRGIYQKWTQIYIKEFDTIWKMAVEPFCEVSKITMRNQNIDSADSK